MRKLPLHSAGGWRRWLYRRGLRYSPSNAMIYERGTLLRPGRPFDYAYGLRDERIDLCRSCAEAESAPTERIEL